jgi:hypothetical protein
MGASTNGKLRMVHRLLRYARFESVPLPMLLFLACATTPLSPTDAGTALQVPACSEANLRQRIPVADGSWLWCVPVDGGQRWEAVNDAR